MMLPLPLCHLLSLLAINCHFSFFADAVAVTVHDLLHMLMLAQLLFAA